MLTQCPNCHRRCFTDATSCANCLQTFKPGVLQAYAIAEEKSFSIKANAMFLSLFLMWLAAGAGRQYLVCYPYLLRAQQTAFGKKANSVADISAVASSPRSGIVFAPQAAEKQDRDCMASGSGICRKIQTSAVIPLYAKAIFHFSLSCYTFAHGCKI